MPRVITANAREINLRRIIQAARMTQEGFRTMLAEEVQIDIAQSSFKLLLQKGIIPKWVDKKQVEGFIMTRLPFVMQSLELTAPQIWDYAEQEQGKRFVFEASEDDYAKKLKTYMEVTMLRLDTMRHFKLAQNPFILDIRRESEIFMGSSHQFAFEVMKQTAETGGFAVITGEVGAGKSTVRRKFFEDARQNKICQIIYPESIDKSRLTAKDVLYSIIYDLTEAKPQGNKEALSRQAKALLLARSNNNERTVLVIEEAHDLPVTTLKFLKRIWELENGLQRLLGIILIGQNELETRLYGRNSTEIREVTARTAHARVEALGKEMPSYISHKFKCAKADVNRIISPEALKLLVERMKITDRMGKEKSMGYPLFVSNVMIRLMNYAAEAGEELITPEIIETVGV